ncbi:hypothetical protein KSF73_03525 [Burkholderiaceae bacterium DAT-1]|nr:hypothetical protein [Burkholderiaceae bacterium DAT-1]
MRSLLLLLALLLAGCASVQPPPDPPGKDWRATIDISGAGSKQVIILEEQYRGEFLADDNNAIKAAAGELLGNLLTHLIMPCDRHAWLCEKGESFSVFPRDAKVAVASTEGDVSGHCILARGQSFECELGQDKLFLNYESMHAIEGHFLANNAQWHVSGLRIGKQSNQPGFIDWLVSQNGLPVARIRVKGSTQFFGPTKPDVRVWVADAIPATQYHDMATLLTVLCANTVVKG